MHHLARCSICCLALMMTASFTRGEENRPQGDKAPQAERGGPAVVERLLEAVAERRGNKVRWFRLSDAHKTFRDSKKNSKGTLRQIVWPGTSSTATR
jgi:hypothetical protein